MDSGKPTEAERVQAVPAFISGLEGVPAAETVLSRVDGEAGRLIVHGHELADFVAHYDFERAAAALWSAAAAEGPVEREREPAGHEREPAGYEREPAEHGRGSVRAPDSIRAALAAARVAAFARLGEIAAVTDGMSATDALRLALASLHDTDDAPIAVTGAMPVLVAGLARRAAGFDPVPPDPAAGHVEDFLTMLRGAPPSVAEAEALRVYLLTVLDHGMNASTFTSRVVASTGAGLVGAVVAAYSALTGPLHGGAPEPVLDMLDAIGRPEHAPRWIDAALRRGERLMGFGHRVYRVRDPRADVLRAALERLSPAGPKLELARAVEAAALDALRRAKPERRIETNVEFYTAMLLDALRIPRASFTGAFAVGRVVGWTAHALEQRRIGRLIRPTSIYIGPPAPQAARAPYDATAAPP